MIAPRWFAKTTIVSSSMRGPSNGAIFLARITSSRTAVSVVTKINTYPEGIEVFTKNGLKFYGDAALVTVPLGTLKKNTIIFDPTPLPTATLTINGSAGPLTV